MAITLLADSGVILLMILDGLWRRDRRITVERTPLDRLSIGRENPVHLHLTSGKYPATVQIRDAYPPAFLASVDTQQISLLANQHTHLNYTVIPFKRGEYAWGDVQVRQLGAWGLTWQDWTVPQSQSVAVYPDLLGLRSLSIRLALQTTGNLRQTRRQGMGTEFAELREYATGDDPRLVDWKATARRSRLLVKVLEPEQEQPLIILLDRGRLMTAQLGGLTRFDWGLNATLSLALAAIHRGDRVGVGVFDHQLHCWIPPDRGQRQLSKLIDQLTPIQPALLEPDYLGAITAIATQQSRRALVVLITEVIDPTASAELLMAMTRLVPRHLPFCVTLRDAQIDTQAHTPTTEVEATYARAVALDLLSQRQLALATLKQQGVLILDAPAHQLSDELVDRYLRLKAHSQI
jgi:uncharacterized protein (DUF58 family)